MLYGNIRLTQCSEWVEAYNLQLYNRTERIRFRHHVRVRADLACMVRTMATIRDGGGWWWRLAQDGEGWRRMAEAMRKIL